MDHAKFWFRRHQATTDSTAIAVFQVFVAGLCIAPAVGALAQDTSTASATQTESAQVAAPSVLLEFIDSVNGVRARFIQEVWSDDQRLLEVAQGAVELQRPGRFRWHYETPYEQFIVADGESLWMYDVDIAQVTRTPLDANDPGNPAALLSGDTEVLHRFEVVDSWELDDELWVELAPKSPTIEYSTVRIAFAASGVDAVPRALEFDDGLDQTTLIRFEGAETNPLLADDHFRFVPPEGVHVLGDTGR